MYKKSLKIMSLLLVLCISFSFMGLNPANAVQSDKINNMLTIAENEVGYLETTYDDGTFTQNTVIGTDIQTEHGVPCS